MQIHAIRISLLIGLLATMMISPSRAKLPEVGQAAPHFELEDSRGHTHKLTDYKGQIVVLHFQSCRCPWDVAYQPILNGIAKRFAALNTGEAQANSVQFLAINSNRTEDMTLIQGYTQEADMPYPVLKDPGNIVADAYAAKTTPHIYVINSDDQQTLAYKGGIEKAPLSPGDCGKSSEQYLEPVLESLIKDAIPPVSETRSIGCSIKRQ